MATCARADDDNLTAKKRRSRWEADEKPDAGAIMVSPSGVPQALVLAGGIKARLLDTKLCDAACRKQHV